MTPLDKFFKIDRRFTVIVPDTLDYEPFMPLTAAAQSVAVVNLLNVGSMREQISFARRLDLYPSAIVITNSDMFIREMNNLIMYANCERSKTLPFLPTEDYLDRTLSVNDLRLYTVNESGDFYEVVGDKSGFDVHWMDKIIQESNDISEYALEHFDL